MPNLQPCAAKLWGEHSFRLSRTRQQLNRTYFAAGDGIEPARHPWLSRPSRSFFTCTHHAILLRNRCCFPGRPRRHRRRRVAHHPLRQPVSTVASSGPPFSYLFAMCYSCGFGTVSRETPASMCHCTYLQYSLLSFRVRTFSPRARTTRPTALSSALLRMYPLFYIQPRSLTGRIAICRRVRSHHDQEELSRISLISPVLPTATTRQLRLQRRRVHAHRDDARERSSRKCGVLD